MKRRPNTSLGVVAAALAAAAVLIATSSAIGRSQAAPSNTTEPSIAPLHLVSVGTGLTGHQGSWSGTAPITYAYEWLRCNDNAEACKPISAATSTSYTVTTGDAGHTIRFQVTAKNAGGKTTALSNATNVVPTKAGAPVESAPPTISGTPTVGTTLTATTGTWRGTPPISYTFKWQSCNSSVSSCPANGATGNTYTVASADSGKRIRVKVVAKNSDGQTAGLSDPTEVITSGSGGGTGIITLPDGEKSIAASAIPKDQRMIVDQVQFNPNPVTSRSVEITVRIKVTDTQNYVVRGALVAFRSTPILTSTPTDAPTGTDGWLTYRIQPRSDFPIKTGYNVQFYVKAYRQGDPTLSGIYGSRLVQVATRTP